ncbi:protein MALE DISCOVERER 2-like isoform X2 [Ipomoea triloba]|uniref:protein MALE DISCOVERER 2-like isoform X2 n=1 Tax=Ipomoea triloba TaxID=35885 RepID=UPI00125E8C15|nr:protein MALE DISCOVERER 2-like isoform X2 [Ipomoea triloba]
MGSRWTIHGIQFSYLALLILVSDVHGCCSLNSEGLALLEFRARVEYDPHRALENWNVDDCDPCLWSGIHCVDGNVQMLDLNGHELEGTLAPELGNLPHLKVLVLSKNHFSGVIPQEVGQLEMLEVLDLTDNNLSGTIPAQIGGLQLLRSLLLCNNNFEGSIPSEIGKLNFLTQFQFDPNLTSDFASGTGCVNRKFGDCIWHVSWNPLRKADFLLTSIKVVLMRYLNRISVFNLGKGSLHQNTSCYSDDLPSSPSPHIIHTLESPPNPTRRKLLEGSNNLAAAPANGGAPLGNVIAQPSSRSSGSFPAVPGNVAPSSTTSPPQQESGTGPGPDQGEADIPVPDSEKSRLSWKYIVAIFLGLLLLIIIIAIICICRSRAARSIGPWKTGLSGQLQKAFVTGVPKLNRSELETACEDFSNIISTHAAFTMYKGTLSSGVEIVVASTAISSMKDWSKRAEIAFRKKIDTLSRINHKNFVNLIGYCEEDEPFTRMMVFEYAPNGTLFEHLHVKEVEHLDWNTRMRIIMGTAYCIQYMHDLNPPLPHSNISSKFIYLTDDYAAKIAEMSFWEELATKSKSGENEENSELPPLVDPETNIYSFGLVLLETVTAKLPYSEEQGPLLNWAAQYMSNRQSYSQLVDPTLKSFNEDELALVCEVIQECVRQDTRKRPTIKEVIEKLRKVLDISPEAAVPRLSPLWWAELEILSAEAP